MCGIVGYIGKKQASPILLEGLKRLEYRGYDSAGISTITTGKLLIQKTSGKISELERGWLRYPETLRRNMGLPSEILWTLKGMALLYLRTE